MDTTSKLKCSTSSETTVTDGNDVVVLDHGKDDNPEEGTRRYYECTFCKRGFTNAQALGGHMNIHRKDRVKLTKNHNHRGHHVVMNPKTSSSTTEDACYNELPKPSVCRDHQDKCGFQVSSEINFLEIRSNFGETSCFYGVLDANYLTLRVGSSHPSSSHGECYCNTTTMKSTTRTTNGNNIKEEDQEELDLELRLGHFYG